MKRPALQNKRVIVLRMAFRVRKVFGTFEKRAPEPEDSPRVAWPLSLERARVRCMLFCPSPKSAIFEFTSASTSKRVSNENQLNVELIPITNNSPFNSLRN